MKKDNWDDNDEYEKSLEDAREEEEAEEKHIIERKKDLSFKLD